MSKSLWYFAAAVTLAAALISCGGKGNQSETAAPAANTAGKPVDSATAGTVTGTIKLDGTAPKPRNINMAAEPNCAKAHSTPATTEDIGPGDGGTLQNVVVYLKGDFSAYSFPPEATPVMIDQKGCQYHPHVLALQTGEPLSVINSDMTTHNIHPVPKDNREWNESQPPGAQPIMQSFARPEVSIPVKCNVHPWMKAYIAVFNNPYYAGHRQGRLLHHQERASRDLHRDGLARIPRLAGPDGHRRPERIEERHPYVQGRFRRFGLIALWLP